MSRARGIGISKSHKERLFSNSNWDKRRRVIYLALIYCAVVVGYIVFFGSDTAVHQQVALGLIGLAGGIIGSYCFAAVWDDKSKREAALAAESIPPDPPRTEIP